MTNEQILKKAFIKAIINGWKGTKMRVYPVLPPIKDETRTWGGNGIWLSELLTEKEYEKYKDGDWNFPGRTNNPWMPDEYYHIIFSRDFAIPFWGKQEVFTGRKKEDCQNEEELHFPAWQFHLQEMVLYENPLEYIEKFL